MNEEKKGAMVLGIGAALAGVLLLFKKKKPPLPEPPERGIVVALLNPPSGANKWQISIMDWGVTKVLSWGVEVPADNIKEFAVFEIPGWEFPLRIDIAIYEKWQVDGEWHGKQLYRVQSHRPYLWDWDLGDWGEESDPTYREIFIPDYGSYYFTVSTEKVSEG